MKDVYYIGRDDSCDIVLQDDSNVISRTHAVLRIGKGGRYTISDQSMNGTYINGIRISPGVEVPVSRTDIVSFAHLIDFDWDLIPDVAKKRRIVVFSIIGGLLLLAGLVWGGYVSFVNKKPVPFDNPGNEMPADSLKTATDSTKVAPAEPKKKSDGEKIRKPKGSVKKEKQESPDTTGGENIKQKKKVNAIF